MSKTKAKPTTPADATRVQAAVAKENSGQIPPDSHVQRMQRAAAKNYGKSGRKKSK